MHRRISFVAHLCRSLPMAGGVAVALVAAASIRPAAAQTVIAFDQASNYSSNAQITTLNGGTGFSSAFVETVNGGGYFRGDAQGNGNGGATATTINSSGTNTSFGIYGGNANNTTGEFLQRTLNRPLIANSGFSFGFDNGFIDSGATDQFAIGSATNNNLITFGFLGGGQNYLVNGVDTGIGYTQNGLNVAVKFSSATAYTLSFYTLDNPTNIKTVAGTVAAGSTLNTITASNNQNHGGSQYDLYINNLQETAPEPTSLAGMLAGAGICALLLPIASRQRRVATVAVASRGLR